jgi:aldehyde dehydrogenase (NAD+)
VTISRSDALGLILPPSFYSGGEWLTTGLGTEQHLHIDPSTGLPTRPFLSATERDIDVAVGAARAALPAWMSMAPSRRRALLLHLGDLIEAASSELGALTSLEMGQPVRAATAGAAHAAEWFRYFAGWADKIEGSVIPLAHGAVLDYVLPEPYGVVAAIIPWNGPVVSLALKLAPALAAGNTIVAKPPLESPFSSLYFAKLCEQAGIPAGVINVLPGGAEAGRALCAHPGVDKISFTGGSAAASAAAVAAAHNHTPLVLELGGKSASLVFDDADPRVVGKLSAIFSVQQNAGQGCFLPTRLFVQRARYREVIDRVLATVETMTVGDPFESSTAIGPVVSQTACERILASIDDAVSRGDGRLLTGGARAVTLIDGGAYLQPTVFGDVGPGTVLAQEEIFGPVLAIGPFDTEDEAIALANGTRYGLAGYVWTQQLGRAHRVAAALRAGYVSVNGMATLPPGAPFGGVGASGHGVEGGRWGLNEFLRPKNVHVALG